MVVYTGSAGNGPITADKARELSEKARKRLIESSLANIYASVRKACGLGERKIDIASCGLKDPGINEEALDELEDMGYTVDGDYLCW